MRFRLWLSGPIQGIGSSLKLRKCKDLQTKILTKWMLDSKNHWTLRITTVPHHHCMIEVPLYFWYPGIPNKSCWTWDCETVRFFMFVLCSLVCSFKMAAVQTQSSQFHMPCWPALQNWLARRTRFETGWLQNLRAIELKSNWGQHVLWTRFLAGSIASYWIETCQSGWPPPQNLSSCAPTTCEKMIAMNL